MSKLLILTRLNCVSYSDEQKPKGQHKFWLKETTHTQMPGNNYKNLRSKIYESAGVSEVT